MHDVARKQNGHMEEAAVKRLQQQWIDFCAIGGVITESDGKISTMSIEDFAAKIEVNSSTLRRWRQTIPDFADRVRARREELFPASRETALFNRLYVLAMTGKGQPAVTAANTLLGHFSKLQLPVQRQDVKVTGGFLDMMQAAARSNVIEGESVYVTEPQTDTRGSGEDTGALPPAS